MDYELFFTEEYSYISQIHDALYSYNLSKNGLERVDVHAAKKPEAAALVIADKAGKCYGGVAYHWENEPRHIFVDYLFIDEALRGRKLGEQLFAKLEESARAAGAENITLTTNTYQAPGFYKKLGFTEISCKDAPTPNCPENKHYTFCKTL